MGGSAPTAEFDSRGFLSKRRALDRDLIATLTIIEGPSMSQLFQLGEGRRAFRAGRAEDMEIRLDAVSVSRQHAVFTVHRGEDRPRVRVEDSGSTNGLFVNQKQVAEAWLSAGDKVRIGDFVLRFEWMNREEVQYHESVHRRLQDDERDPLTGLYVRRVLEERVPNLIESNNRDGWTACCLLVDLDHFKAINDRYGHLVGDEVLRAAAGAVVSVLRRDDLAVRYGGEEMLLILPGAPLRFGAEIAGRVCEALRALRFIQALDLRVTASVGVAELRAGEGAMAWIHRCDQALYEAKSGGRDRVVIADAGGEGADPRSTRSLRAASPSIADETVEG